MPPKKGSRTESYDLSNSRQKQAFEALMQRDDDGDDPAKKSKPGRKDERRGDHFFRLRDAEASPSTAPDPAQELLAMFGGALDAALVKDVLAACGGDPAAAAEALLTLTSGSGGQQDAGASSSAAAAAATGTAAGGSGAPAPAPLSLPWDVLPPDVKGLVLSLLPARDLSRAASACREFALRARATRAAVRHLAMPPGLSYTATMGMVAAHASADTIDLSRLERRMAPTPDAPPDQVAAALANAEVRLQATLVAVQQGEAASSRAVPIRGLVLRGLAAASDALLQDALQSLRHLRRLDLSHCPRITNRSVQRLAAYRAEPPTTWGAGGAAGDGGSGDDDAVAGPAEEAGAAGGVPQPPSSEAAAGGDGGSATAGALMAANPAVHDPVGAGVAAALAADLAAVSLAQQQEAARAATACERPGLAALSLRGLDALADDGVRSLLAGPATRHHLTSLDVSGCRGVTSAGLQVPPLGVLRQLRASSCNRLSTLALQLPASHPLASLDLSDCRQLLELTLAAPALVTLRLSGCGALYRLRLRCGQLRELVLSHCGALAEFFEDAWRVPQLRELNMFGCRRAHGRQLEAVLSACPELRILNLNGCWAVREFSLREARQLRALDVTGCTSLAALAIASPCLTELRAQGCPNLARLDLQPAPMGLATLLLANCASLREVVVVAAVAPPAAPPQGEEGEGGDGAGAEQQPGEGVAEQPRPARRPKLELRGCVALPEAGRGLLVGLVRRAGGGGAAAPAVVA